MWQADIFLSSRGKEKKSKTWKRRSVGDNPHSQWIIRNSWFAQFQDFLKLNSQNLNPNYTVKSVCLHQILLNREYKSWLTWKSEIIRGPDGDIHATEWWASPSAYCNDGPLKGNKLFASTAGLKKPVFQHNTIKNELIFLFLQQLYIFTHP